MIEPYKGVSLSNNPNSFLSKQSLGGKFDGYDYFDISSTDVLGTNSRRLPISLRVLLENLLRHEDGLSVSRDDIVALAHWPENRRSDREVAFHPARILMPDSSGAPLLADLSAMRDAMSDLKQDPAKINPVIPVDLVIDHSVIAEHFGSSQAFQKNIDLEFEQNHERYSFLRWAQKAYRSVRIVPPGNGIVHQINIEYLAHPVQTKTVGGRQLVFPDTLVGGDSHTPMVNALGVFGWGVGGIEAASAMLGEPISLLIPEVVGCKLTGTLREGVTSTDLALTVVQRLREASVVGKLVEFFGSGVAGLTLPDRATLANMAPEYGATMGFFPIDDETISYLIQTGREQSEVELVEHYARVQGLWAETGEPTFSNIVEIDLSNVETSLAGPRRPEERVSLADVPAAFLTAFPNEKIDTPNFELLDRPLQHGDIVIAAITSCTNTSNPSVMIRAGLLARNAVERGLSTKPWVKGTLSPGSRVVSDYLANAGLQQYLDALGFQLTGYGCMTCSGASGELSEFTTGQTEGLKLATVLSGNRNFEGRIHSAAAANFIASPPLVVAYAIAGSVLADLRHTPLGSPKGKAPVYLRDIWPSDSEVQSEIDRAISPALFLDRYKSIFEGSAEWKSLAAQDIPTFSWNPSSTYLKQPPYFSRPAAEVLRQSKDIEGARTIAVLGDSITTDHISPVGSIDPKSPAGLYLRSQGVSTRDFNTYLTRRANHEVMIRGTFANVRLRNQMTAGLEGGFTRYLPTGEIMPIYDAAIRYLQSNTPLLILAGKNYGAGSSRDWAAKGTALLGVRAVIAESFERIHRSNLVGMGVIPLQFMNGGSVNSLGLDGNETIDIAINASAPRTIAKAVFKRANGTQTECDLLSRIDTLPEQQWYLSGGILPFVLRKLSGSQHTA